MSLQQIAQGVVCNDISNSKNIDSNSSVSSIETLYPGYLHHLFRNVIKKNGTNALFAELSEQINSTSWLNKYPYPSIGLTR